MPGPLPKPDDKRQRRNVRPVLAVLPSTAAAALVAPAPPSGLLKRQRERWAAFWASPVAAAVDRVTDLPALERLFVAYDELARCGAAFRKARVVEGSAGQPVLNPLSRYLAQLTQAITLLEDRLGCTPRARLALGIQLGEARRSLNDLIAESGYDDDE